jgi:NTP pyrophosphatase (non-canonical NTP hydrolase)
MTTRRIMYSVSESVQGLNDMAADLYNVSSEHGFWEGKEVTVGGAGIGVWTERELPEALMLIVSEAAEALEDYRDGKGPDEFIYGPGNPRKPEGIPSEMADIIIRALDVCGRYGIDIERALKEKIDYNRSRLFKHGRVH